MPTTNPLRSSSAEHDIVRTARLYVLIRDAYLSPRGEMAAKLDALADLCPAAADGAEEARPLAGVRFVESLRNRLTQAGLALPLATRRLIVLDVLTSIRPPVTGRWAGQRAELAADVATYLDADLSVGDVDRLARHVERRRRRLAGSPLRLPRASEPLPDPLASFTGVIGEVNGLQPSHALAEAVLLLAGGSPHPTMAGGGVLESMPRCGGSALDRFVGTALARRDTEALVHHLAALDTAAVLCPQLRPALADRLRALRSDLAQTIPSTAGEQRRLYAAARIVDAARARLGDRSRPAPPRQAPVPHPGPGARPRLFRSPF